VNGIRILLHGKGDDVLKTRQSHVSRQTESGLEILRHLVIY
jgi:hypothetical protein